MVQLPLPFAAPSPLADPVQDIRPDLSYREKLEWLLAQDLGFHQSNSSYASHNFHAFPAKFPPQLPRLFINALTEPGDVVLDPMVGSGTTVVETILAGRQGIGCDIDPLAILISGVKVTPLNPYDAAKAGRRALMNARKAVKENPDGLWAVKQGWDAKTQQFVDYWFAPQSQLELLALRQAIEAEKDESVRNFLRLAFSAIIITKTGGVSLALDLAHTRPHRAKVIMTQSGEVLAGQGLIDENRRRLDYMTKTLRSPFAEFEKRLQKNVAGIGVMTTTEAFRPWILFGNAQALPLQSASVDLIVTSPPYASNAIDYMRAHKFSLVWFGYPIDNLGQRRRQYIGGEATSDFVFEPLPKYTAELVQEIAALDERKGMVLRRYYSEMTRTMREMLRVLKPGRAAIIVVGSSVMRGRDTETATCLADIGRSLGFDVPGIGVRQLDRDRRMMPAGNRIDANSQIQKRMHEEYVIGLLKPES